MRNRKAYLLVVCILVVALLASLVIGCTPKNEGPTGSFGNGSSIDSFEGAQSIEKADKYIKFELYADPDKISFENVKDNVKVVDIAEKDVKVNVRSEGNGIYTVYAPDGGYAFGSQYCIILSGGIRFVDYTANKLSFTINTDAYANIQYKNGTLVISENLINGVDKEGVDATGSEYGTINVQNSNITLAVGDVFIVDQKSTGLQQAYKVTGLNDKKMPGFTVVNYVKPNLEDVYDEFSFVGTEELSADKAGQVTIDKQEVLKNLDNSQVADSIINVFGKKPEFNLDVKLEGKQVVAYLTVTVPEVVYSDGGKADLIFGLENRFSAVASSTLNKSNDMNISDINFAIDADITNEVTFNVGIFSQAAYSKVEGVQDLVDKIKNIKIDGMADLKPEDEAAVIDKMNQLAEVNNGKNGEDSLDIDLFRWTLPIAEGAASISYDADLAFSFNFSGQFGLAAKTTLKYVVGATYNHNDGIKTYAKPVEGNKVCDEVGIKLDGNAKLKVGLNQRLSLDVLAGVLGVGLRANVGNFNRLYGYADAKWVASNTPNEKGQYEMEVADKFDGTMYLEGGIYWDVNLDAGVKLGGLIKLDILKDKEINKTFNISSGEEVLYTGGSKELVRNVVSASDDKEGNNVVVRSAVSTLSFDKEVFNIVKHVNEVVDIDNQAAVTLKPVTHAAYYTIDENKVLTINEAMKTTNFDFAVEATYTYVNCFGKEVSKTSVINYTYKCDLTLPSDELAYNKDGSAFKVDVVSTQGAPSVLINGEKVVATASPKADVANTYVVSIDSKVLDQYVAGDYKFEVLAGNDKAVANLAITGQISLIRDTGVKTHHIYCADQLKQLFESNTIAADNIFVLDNDIDMSNIVLKNTDTKLLATLDGNNKKITGLNVKVVDGKTAAIIDVNEGTIKNLTVESNVEIAKLDVAMNSEYYISAFVGVNNGKMQNVNVNANVVVNSLGAKTGTTVYVGTVVAKNNSAIENCGVTAPCTINVTYKYDLVGNEFVVTGAADNELITLNKECLNGSNNGLTKVRASNM